jgi:hypothetical protein
MGFVERPTRSPRSAAMKPLIAQYGADRVKTMVDLLA